MNMVSSGFRNSEDVIVTGLWILQMKGREFQIAPLDRINKYFYMHSRQKHINITLLEKNNHVSQFPPEKPRSDEMHQSGCSYRKCICQTWHSPTSLQLSYIEASIISSQKHSVTSRPSNRSLLLMVVIKHLNLFSKNRDYQLVWAVDAGVGGIGSKLWF